MNKTPSHPPLIMERPVAESRLSNGVANAASTEHPSWYGAHVTSTDKGGAVADGMRNAGKAGGDVAYAFTYVVREELNKLEGVPNVREARVIIDTAVKTAQRAIYEHGRGNTELASGIVSVLTESDEGPQLLVGNFGNCMLAVFRPDTTLKAIVKPQTVENEYKDAHPREPVPQTIFNKAAQYHLGEPKKQPYVIIPLEHGDTVITMNKGVYGAFHDRPAMLAYLGKRVLETASIDSQVIAEQIVQDTTASRARSGKPDDAGVAVFRFRQAQNR